MSIFFYNSLSKCVCSAFVILEKPINMIFQICFSDFGLSQIIRYSRHPWVDTIKSVKGNIQALFCHINVIRIYFKTDAVSFQLLANAQCSATSRKRIQNGFP